MQHFDVGGSTRVSIDPARPFDPANPRTNDNDGYPDIIADQRSMLPGGAECLVAEDVFWYVWVPFLEAKGMRPKFTTEAVVPYINESRWVADCGLEVGGCGSGMACWDRNPYACCMACGRAYKVRWQLPATRSEIVRLLAGRPPVNRNWEAHKGETATELAVQNVLMQGVAPEHRGGLLVAANVHMPDEFASPTEWLDRMQAGRRRAARA